MPNKRILLSLALGTLSVLLLFGQETPSITPLPTHLATRDGHFVLCNGQRISVPAYPDDSLKNITKQFAREMGIATGIKMKTSGNPSKASMQILLKEDLAPEGYRLQVTPEHLVIHVSKPAGLFYAFQTLKMMMPRNVMAMKADKTVTKWEIPAVDIEDAPRYGWRGFMLDVGRHFFGKEEIKRVLDMMATYKMNRFHWHLTEDQGWRIEIKKYPLLTKTGAWRNSKALAWGDTKTDGLRYGGFYTRKDITEIIAYARQRFIEVIPEIDIPGHSQAAVASYPALLACDPEKPHEVWQSQGVSPDVINVANPAAVQFAKDVIDELITLFPSHYIHLGGDECPTDKWEKNALCQTLLAKLGSTDYRDLQQHFYRQLQDYIQAKPQSQRRKLIFWNEVLHGNTKLMNADNITVMAWVGANGAAAQAAKAGYDNILTPYIPYYINRKQSKNKDEPMSQGSGTETVEAVYAYQPAKDVPPALLPYYKGVQANCWTEWVVESSTLEYLILPRLAAVAEAGWTLQERRKYEDFVRRIRKDRVLYDLRGWNYGKHIF